LERPHDGKWLAPARKWEGKGLAAKMLGEAVEHLCDQGAESGIAGCAERVDVIDRTREDGELLIGDRHADAARGVLELRARAQEEPVLPHELRRMCRVEPHRDIRS